MILLQTYNIITLITLFGLQCHLLKLCLGEALSMNGLCVLII